MSRKILYVYIFLVIIYAVLAFFIPTDPDALEKYNITQTHASLLNLTIVIPLVGIWFAAFYGYSKFRKYADTIRNSKDGKAFSDIANGLGVLALSLPLLSILTTALRFSASKSPDLQPVVTIVSNYASLLFALAAFVLVYKGSRSLAALVTAKESQPRPYVMLGFGLMALLYTYMTLTNPHRQIATGGVEYASYYLPDPLILLTIIIPQIFVWFVGLKTLLNIHAYQVHTDGSVYKQSLSYLARGIAGVIVVSVLLQFLKDMSSSLSEFSLGALLALIYLLLVLMAAGYVYIAVGAKRLQKIEEV